MRTYRLSTPADIDKLPRAARQAIKESNIIGVGHHLLHINQAPAAIMAERIRRADAALSPGNNMTKQAPANLFGIIAILNGA